MAGLRTFLILIAAVLASIASAKAEDGYDLWLRYAPLAPAPAAALASQAQTVSVDAPRSPTIEVAIGEIRRGVGGLGAIVPSVRPAPAATGVRLLRGPAMPAEIARRLKGRREGAFVVDASESGVLIAANDDAGLLYGSFAWLRALSAGGDPVRIALDETPAMDLRMLNHWDNPDGHVERGYAGQSIWDWWHLPGHVDARIADYARANASVGINGAVLNNVNAKADQLSAPFIAKAAAVADVLRPYGIRVYLSARFSAPRDLGGLASADPLDPRVAAWWRAKADEIYAAIPDFGGFLVKANSEGQPGPQDFGRTHADGANMMAAAVGGRGVVIWRAFVYAAENAEDRARQAYSEFRPLDGRFAANVLLQVKNGPIDFQPREPLHPLFGAMPKTPLMMEVQITKEYLGFATHLVFLGPMWEEVLDADTGHRGSGGGTTVADVIDGSMDGHRVSGMAGVANIGDDRNWSGSHFDQANWYAFGRLAWNPRLGSEAIAREWTAQTFSRDPGFAATVVPMMLKSRQAAVDYMTPLGLAHQMATGHHYGPGPWVADLDRPEWNPVYYSRADAGGIGFDRTATGSNAVAQYAPALARRFADRRAVGAEYLLWFHHVGWDEPVDGAPLWETLVRRYDRGVAAVAAMQADWARVRAAIDPRRAGEVADFLAIQHDEAQWWRDASIAYFQSVSRRPLPPGVAAPAHTLDHYRSLSFPYAPGN